MVDLVDIGFSIDSSQIKTAKQELAELGNSFNSATKSASVFEQAFARAAAQSAKDAAFLRDRVRANQDLINTNLGVTNSYKSAEQSASAFGVVLNNIDRASKAFAANFNGVVGITGGRATSNGAGFGAIEGEIERLRLKYDQIYSSSQLYEKSLAELNRAHMLGVTSVKQHEAALESLNMEYQNFQSGVAQAGNRFAQYTAQSASGMSKFGVVTQQVGYQVGDFLVQIQSGTNPLVAFGQQATQLVGVLPLMDAGFLGLSSGALVALSAGLGIVIPLVTAVGAAFMRTSEDAKNASGGIDVYTEAISNLTSEIQKNQEEFLKVKFDTDIFGVASASQQIEDFQDKIDSLQASIDRMRSQGGKAAAFSGLVVGSVEELESQKKALQDQLDTLNAQAEAQRMLNGGLSVAKGLQQAAIRDKQEQLRLAKEQAIAEQTAADKATFLKNVFHAMAGEAGAVSIELDSWAGKLIDAANASTGLQDFLLKQRIDTGMRGRGLPADYYGMDTAPLDTGKLFGNIEFGSNGAAIKPEKEKKGPRGPSSETLENRLQELYKYLDAQKQIEAYMIADEEIAYQQREDLLKSALDKKLITLQDYQTMERDLTARHQEELANIEKVRQTTQIKDAGTFFGGMAAIAQVGGEKTAKAVRLFSAAQAITNSYLAFTQVLSDPSFIGRPWARFGAASAALASGLAAVASIRSGGGGSLSGGGGSGGNKPASVEASTSTQAATPLSVMIQGIKPTDIFTGEQLSTLFDSLYKENRNRGMVFQVAR